MVPNYFLLEMNPYTLSPRASSAAIVSFFETLLVEVGPEIKITIVTLGFIESEMTQGKFLLNEGKMEVDQDLRDVSYWLISYSLLTTCHIISIPFLGDKIKFYLYM